MPRDGAITFGDLIGKLDVLQIECTKCSGRCRLTDLRSDPCGAVCPDLPKWSINTELAPLNGIGPAEP